MAETPQTVRSYLKTASPRFREIYESIDRNLRGIFPDVEDSFESGMPGWKIPRPRHVDPASVKGTLDPNWVQIYLAERKSGITLHLWNPVDFNGFRRRRAELERAGFKLMVGCIRFDRKSAYPMELVVGLLQDLKKSLVEDERGASSESKAGHPAQPPRETRDPKQEALRRQLDEWASEPPMEGGD